MNFSVIMSVYKNDKSEFVEIALDSIINQTLTPSEIILVVDGLITPELNKLLISYEKKYPELFNVIRLQNNQGLGNALRLATESAQNELIARMDSDDTSAPDRFERQIRLFEVDPALSVVGGNMSEFIGSPDNIVAYRRVPLEDAEIKEYMKTRCPMNHVTVMFRKSEVLKVGNYQDWFWNEDYYLWIRMRLAGCKFANVPEVLVNVRTGSDMYARRGGIKYYRSEKALQKYMLDNNVIGFSTYFMNVLKRFIVQVLLPNDIRGWVFRTFARQNKN